MELELSGGALAVRMLLGALSAAITFLLFYYLPQNLGNLLSGLAGSGSSSAGTVKALTSSLIGPSLPAIGLGLTALVFLGVLLRGSRAYGALLVLIGVLFATYVYLLFEGGTVSLSIPGTLLSSGSADVIIEASILMYILLVAPALTVVKGAVVLADLA